MNNYLVVYRGPRILVKFVLTNKKFVTKLTWRKTNLSHTVER